MAEGKPVKIDLFSEQGTVGVMQYAGRLEERYAESLRGAAGINTLARILHREPAAYTAHRLVLLSAGRATWNAVPASDAQVDKDAAEFVNQCIRDMSHDWWQAVKFALSAQAFGFADQEIVWKRRLGRTPGGDLASSAYDDGRVGIRKLAPRRQETVDHWIYDPNGGVQAMVQMDPTNGKEIEIPIDKLLHYIGGDDRGSWEGLGWLEPAYRPAHMIENLEVVQGIGWQRSQVGLPVFDFLTVPDEDVEADCDNIGRNLAANKQQYVKNPAYAVTFRLETVSNSNAGELRNTINQYRWEISALVAATFIRLGTSESSNRALGDSLIDGFTNGIDAALDSVCETLNRHLIPRLFAANPGEFSGITNYPKIGHSNITKLPLAVLQWIDKVQTYLDSAEPVDAVWLRDLIEMPHMSVEDIEKAQAEKAAKAAEAFAQQAQMVAAAAANKPAAPDQPKGGQSNDAKPVDGKSQAQGGARDQKAAQPAPDATKKAVAEAMEDLSPVEQVAILEAAARIVGSGR